MRKNKKIFLLAICLVLMLIFMTGCGSEAKKEMKDAVTAANELLGKNELAFDETTKENLEKAVAKADVAENEEDYVKVAEEISIKTKAYEDSIKQLKQVTNPTEDFLIERAKTVDTITDVEAATEETDSNKIMNKPGGYTSYIAMKSSLITDSYYKSTPTLEAGTDGGAVIEAFKTVEDAKKREQYLAAFDNAGFLSAGTHKVVGTLVIRTSDELTASQQQKLQKAIIDALIRLK